VTFLLEDTDVRFLEKIGLTRSQAHLYFALVKIGNSDALTISRQTKTPRTETYRILDDLEEIGLVEKHLDVPYFYEATPVRLGIESLLIRKYEEYQQNRRELDKFLVSFEKSEKKQDKIQPKITVSKGKQKLLSVLRYGMDNVLSTVDFVTPKKRWLNIYENCQENIKKSLERGVTYRGLLETSDNGNHDLDSIPALQQRTHLELRMVRNISGKNFVVFDKREAAFNYSPGKSLNEAVTLWTNHPNLVAIFEDHYDTLWRNAEVVVFP
jgi:sugar-specific transcriptional regulator TrmB